MLKDYLQAYIESAKEASARSRAMLYFLLLTCIFVVSVVRTSISDISAFDRMIVEVNHALKLHTKRDQSGISQKEADWLKTYKANNPYEDPKQLSERSQFFQNERAKLQMVDVPVIGVKFSSYDVPMMAGLLFAFLAMLLYFSSKLEVRITNKVMELANSPASEVEPALVRELLSLNQVLTVSGRKVTLSQKQHSILSPKLLLLVPFIVQGLLVAGNSRAWIGWKPNPDRTCIMHVDSVTVSVIAWILFLLIGFAVMKCWKVFDELDAILQSSPQ